MTKKSQDAAAVRVKLTVSRAGRVSHKPGDEIEVSPLEAGRMLRAGQIAKPDGPTLKAIAAAESDGKKETASAAAVKPAGVSVATADADILAIASGEVA